MQNRKTGSIEAAKESFLLDTPHPFAMLVPTSHPTPSEALAPRDGVVDVCSHYKSTGLP